MRLVQDHATALTCLPWTHSCVAVQSARSRGLLEVLGCPDRNLTEGELVPGRSRILINIAGISTGIGWWTQALSAFCSSLVWHLNLGWLRSWTATPTFFK